MNALRALLFLPLTACATDGGLEQADFEPADVGDDLSGGPLALGATVDIDVTINTPGSGTPSLQLLPADPEVLQVTGNQLTGLSPGLSAVLALDENNRVLDFFHVFVAPPDRVEIQRLGGIGAGRDLDGGLELLVGDEVVLGARAYRGPQRLAGSAAMGWSSDTDVVTVLLDGDIDRRRVVARNPGKAVVEVETMGLISTLDITVYP